MKKKCLKLSCIFIAIFVVGIAVNIYLGSYTMLDMLSMFGFNLINGILSIIIFMYARKESYILPPVCNVLLIISIILNIKRVRNDNLSYVLSYIDIFEIGYYVILALFLLINIAFFIIYIKNSIKGKK